MSKRRLIVLSLRWYDLRIHQGVLNYAKEHDWDVVANPHMTEALDVDGADGQIVMIGSRDACRERIVKQSSVPVIDLGNYSRLKLPRVYPDNLQAGQLAAEEFLSRGFTRFAIFSANRHWYVEDRRSGFRQAVEKEGHACDIWHLAEMLPGASGSHDLMPDVHAQLQAWLSEAQKPIAVYAIEDERAAQLMRICHELELAVPEQVAIIGTNNDPVICPYTEVPLSSVDLNWEGVGYEAAARLDRLMRGDRLNREVCLIPPTGVIVRKSSQTVAIEDLRVSLALSFILDNSHRHVTVREVTRTAGIPLRTLQWAFQRALNASIQEEIGKRRLERVKDMLWHSDRKIRQIAEDLNFSSAQYLNHFFVKSTGMTPNEYRKRNALVRASQAIEGKIIS